MIINPMEVTIEEMDRLVTLSYFVVGTLFIVYFFAIFIQRFVKNSLRLILSLMFLTIGMLFFNLGGKRIAQDSISFSWIAISNSVMLSIVGLICVYIIYRENKKNKINKEKSSES